MEGAKPIEVAVIGGGCASIAAAFELTRPEHNGKYHVTVYQMGWRLGGKGASGRGPAGRIEEHGLHVWLGSYDNAFRLLRECYAELNQDKQNRRFAHWRDAFFADSHIGIADPSRKGGWIHWTTHFPPSEGLPGDPIVRVNPFSVRGYLARTVSLLNRLLFGVVTGSAAEGTSGAEDRSPAGVASKIASLLRIGALAGATVLIEAIAVLEVGLRLAPDMSEKTIGRLLEMIVAGVRDQLEAFVERDDDFRYKWEIIDIVLAVLVGIVRFGLLSDPRGFEAIDAYECREWLRLNGASERALNSAYLRGLYDLALAYPGGDPAAPSVAAGQALRACMRFFFGYRGALIWKMRAGMGDVVFAPFYEVLSRRGVTFAFFHRLTNVKLCDPSQLSPGERMHVEALEFDVQAKIRDGAEYQPLIEINAARCWPAKPDHDQLEDGARLLTEGREFESHWDRRKVETKTLRVVSDFDFVVLGVSIGAIPYVCGELLARDARWRAMVANVKTVATQAFQIWLNADLDELGWRAPPVTLTGFVKPFDTWADMAQVIPAESWREPPRTVAYFCNVLADPPIGTDVEDPRYPAARQEEVRSNALAFLNLEMRHLWPNCEAVAGGFRWTLLVDPAEDVGADQPAIVGEARFSTQFWTANVNPSDRYVLSLPGTLQHRISPLDNTYDNLTIAGDWTDCGFNEGCVEAAFMSGRLAAHAIARAPALEEIVAYDHP